MKKLVALIVMLVAMPFLAQASSSLPTLKSLDVNKDKSGRVDIKMGFSEPVADRFKSFMTRDPDSIVFDFNKVHNQLKSNHKSVNVGPVKDIQAVQAKDRTRLVIALNKAAKFKTNVDGAFITASLDDSHSHGASHGEKLKKNVLSNVNFIRGKHGGARIEFSMSHPNMLADIKRHGKSLLVDFAGTQMKQNMKSEYKVSDHGTPVQTISVTSANDHTRVSIDAIGNYQHTAYQMNNKFVVEISPMSKMADMPYDPGSKSATGGRLSLNFQSIKVRAALQLLAEFTGINIVASDTVKGSITLHLNDVYWQDALDIILRTQHLDKRELGTIILVAPAKEIAAYEKHELETMQAVRELEPLHSELIQVNYATAGDLALLISNDQASLLSERGRVTVDDRTNMLWVMDTRRKINEVRRIIRRLDKPVKQVLIEARVVEMDKDFERDLGIRWGFSHEENQKSGTLNAANQLAQGVNAADVFPPEDRLNVNLPALAERPASFALAVYNLGHGILLDLELSAIEEENGLEIISSPRLITSDQHPAYIEQGEEIPYQEATSSGATNVEFKKAVLGLHVTPHITPNGRIILNLKVNQDRASAERVLGVPAIETKQIETQVLLDNGETLVLGGVYQQDQRHNVERVPFLGTIPVLGHFFRRTEVISNHKELLIFITPKIINQRAFHS